MHCGPHEGCSCRVVGHRWLHAPGLPAVTALPLLSPSPSSSFYTSALYFPPFFSAHVPPTCRRFFFPPNFFSLTPPSSACLSHYIFLLFLCTVCASSVGGQWILRRCRHKEKGNEQLGICWQTENVHARRTAAQHRCAQSHTLRNLNRGMAAIPPHKLKR